MSAPAYAQDLTHLLHPQRFPNMSGKMAAIVGYILGIKCTEPEFSDIIVTTDGAVLGMQAGDIGFNDFIGARSDLEANWTRLLDAARLSKAQRKAAQGQYRSRIHSA